MLVKINLIFFIKIKINDEKQIYKIVIKPINTMTIWKLKNGHKDLFKI